MTEETNNPGGTDPTTSDDESAVQGDPELPPGDGATTSDPDPDEEDALSRPGDPELPPG